MKFESRHSSCSNNETTAAIKSFKNEINSRSFNILHSAINYDNSPDNADAGGDGTSTEHDILTNSELDMIEMKITNRTFSDNESDEALLADDANLKLIKNNIQSILKKFFTNVQDLEHYKMKFNDIISKKHTKGEMDDFVTEVITHLKQNESQITLDNKSFSCSCKGDCFCSSPHYPADTLETQSEKCYENRDVNIIAKNDNFKSETSDGRSHRADAYFLKPQSNNTSKTRYLSERSVSYSYSEMILRASFDIDIGDVASAENIMKLEAKRLEIEKYNASEDSDKSEKDIPVKISHPKWNIHTNEDFSCRRNDESTSLISRICSFFCKKLRRT